MVQVVAYACMVLGVCAPVFGAFWYIAFLRLLFIHVSLLFSPHTVSTFHFPLSATFSPTYLSPLSFPSSPSSSLSILFFLASSILSPHNASFYLSHHPAQPSQSKEKASMRKLKPKPKPKQIKNETKHSFKSHDVRKAQSLYIFFCSAADAPCLLFTLNEKYVYMCCKYSKRLHSLAFFLYTQ